MLHAILPYWLELINRPGAKRVATSHIRVNLASLKMAGYYYIRTFPAS